MPKPSSSVADLLDKHAPDPTSRCGTCQEPHGPLLVQLLERAIETQQRVTVRQLLGCLHEGSGYGLAHASLSRHLRDCVPGLFAKCNTASGRGG